MRSKNRKRAGVGILALLLSLLLSMTALAAPSIGEGAPSEGTITVTKAGAEFTAYQILEASQSGDAYVYKAADAFAAFFGNPAYGDYKTEDISKLNSAEEIKTFASQLHKFAVDQDLSGIKMESGNATTVKLGYYLVLETSSASEGAVVASTAMLVPVPQEDQETWNYHVTVLPKDNEPSLEKNILLEDKNSGTKRVETSTAAVGDKIKYEVTAKIPTYDKNAVNIKYQITDTLSKGLTFDRAQGMSVMAGQETLKENEDYTWNVIEGENDTKLVIDFKYDKIKGYADNGLTLVYAAKLNEKAVIKSEASEGNPNTVTLEYTNNPDVEDSYKTLTDKVTTYTWGFGVHKVDSENIKTDLAGAEFQLKDAKENEVASYTYDEAGNVVVLTGNAKTMANGMVYFTGLNAGVYKIYEVKAPAGYSLLSEPVEVTITPVESQGVYTGAAQFGITNANSAASQADHIEMKDGNVLFQVTIKNHKGISLPGTGGIGTTGFMAAGAALLVLAGGLLTVYMLKNRKRGK